MATNHVSRSGLIVSALSVGVSLAIKIGTKLTDKGKLADIFARFKVPVVLDSGSISEALVKLLKLGTTRINVSVPKTEAGLLSMAVRPVQTAERLYVACVHAAGFDYDSSLSRDWINSHLSALQLPLLPEPKQEEEVKATETVKTDEVKETAKKNGQKQTVKS